MVYLPSVHVFVAQKIRVVEGVAKSWVALIAFFYVKFDVAGYVHIGEDIQILSFVQLKGVFVVEGQKHDLLVVYAHRDMGGFGGGVGQLYLETLAVGEVEYYCGLGSFLAERRFFKVYFFFLFLLAELFEREYSHLQIFQKFS